MKTSSSFFVVSPIFCETVAAISQAVDPSFMVPLYVWLKVFLITVAVWRNAKNKNRSLTCFFFLI